jgi:hypothetical protein
MVDLTNPFGPQHGNFFETFDPYSDPISTSAAFYGGGPCDPQININCICVE